MENEQRYCVFCCRELFSSGVLEENGRQEKPNTNTVYQFFELFSRYCSTGLKMSHSNDYRSCDNCVVALKDFTDLYSQMDGLRLKLNGRINTLKTIMEQADKIPSRQKAFGPVENINHGKNYNEDTRKLRNRFVHDCSTHLKSSWPKIKLSRHHSSSTINEMTITLNLEQNQANHEMETECPESTKQKEMSNGTTDKQVETLKLNTDSLAAIDHYKNFVKPENTVFNIITELDQGEILVEENPQNENITQNNSGNLIGGESLTSEDTTTEAQVEINPANSLDYSINSISETIPDIISNTITSSCDQVDNELAHNIGDDSYKSPIFDSNTTTREQCLGEENEVEIENCASVSRIEGNEMEIEDNEQMYPNYVVENEVHNEDLNYPPIDNQIVIPELPVDLLDELVQSDELPIVQKRSLRKIFQCKICKLTFSSSERLNVHNKSHDDDDNNDESDEGHQSTNSVMNGSSSGSESDQDCERIVNKKSKHYVQCSQCTKYFRKGNDINHHMKTVHPDEIIDKHDSKSANKDDVNNSSTLQPLSEPTLLNSGSSSVLPITKPLNLLETLLRLRFKCDLCKLTFSTALRLEEHVKSHNHDHGHSDNVKNISSVKQEDKQQSDISDKDQQSDISMSSLEDSSESSYSDSESSSSKNDENSESELECKPSVSQKLKTKKKQIIPGAKYQCNICKLRFATKDILQYHQKTHISDKTRAGTTKCRTHERKKFQCSHCPKRFYSPQQKCVHIWNYHNNHNKSPYIEDFIIMENFTIHDVIHKGNAKYSCQIANCKQKFLTQETLNDHSKLHGQFTCKFCPERFEFAPELALHEAKTHEDYTENRKGNRFKFKCPRCSYKPQEQNQYVNHFLQTHFNLLMDICRCLVCKAPLYAAKITLPFSMLGHHLSHHQISNAKSPEEIYRCGDCPAYFITPFQLSNHKQWFHSRGVKRHTCTDCAKKFLRPEQLRKHRMQVHKAVIGELQYSCEVDDCKRRFETKYELDRHNMHRHSGKDPSLMCTECGKRFGGKSALHRHKQTIHNADFQEKKRKEKTIGFVCEQCGKKFVKKDVLLLHYKSHSGPESWNYCCELCSKKCLTAGKLKEHMRVHTQEKPFVCEVCGQMYAHRHNWRLHLKSKHGQT